MAPLVGDLVQRLKELGISEKSARYALQRENNDVERAANYVFSGNAGRDEVRAPSNERVSSRPGLDSVPEHDISTSPQNTLSSLSDEDDDEDEEERKEARPGRWMSLPSRLRPKRLSIDLGSDQADDKGKGKEVDEIGRTRKLTHEASELILGALSSGGNTKGSGSDKKNAAGAIGMLGLRAASAHTGSGGVPIPSSGSSSAIGEQPIHRSQPVGGKGSGRRSASPFFRARKSREDARKRDTSPEVGALSKDRGTDGGAESDGESVGQPKIFRPQASAYETDDSGSEDETDLDTADGDETLLDEDELFNEDGEFFDEETSKNTTANAVYFEGDASGVGGAGPIGDTSVPHGEGVDTLDNYGEETEQDILGEGPNVVVPPQPMFQASLFAQPTTKKETTKSGLELETSRPVYARDRCTITLTHGDPDGALEESGKRLRRYVVLSDLSEESRYAVEWAVGTVARDGDELFLISVKEEESKVDPKSWSDSDRAQKLRVQKERQTTCLLLTRQVTGLLQRTHLNITVTCQFLHAKNSRHMLLDLIDFLEPTMCIVGSRGLGKLKGILLGSTSHYLVQKSSVPIMVARRRLQRPLRRTNPADLRHAARTPLASASIEKTASSKQEDEVVDVAEAEKEEGTSPEKRGLTRA